MAIRTERVGQEIQAAVTDVLARGLVRDPRVGFITITGVKVSPDLRVARVYYSQIGSEADRQRTAEGLKAAQAFFRREVTSRVKLRVSPEIIFSWDGSLEEGDKIERLLKEVKTKEGW
ncbi:MAG: 30S ribosome-binding factor RbfA [Myxococcaceae bacterium]|nr:30S ribosome-binding factor RbfA [Myxococcaceae bacterium]